MHALICCDEQDNTVGHFVRMCADRAYDLINDIGVIVHRINSNQLSGANVSAIANQNGNNPFICAAFSHGNDSALVNTSLNEDYVSVTVNEAAFRNVFFYTWACCSAQTLGPSLTENFGCAVYIGHRDEVGIPDPSYDPDILEIFVECAVSGLRSFYSDGFSAVNSLNRMRDLYDEKFEELVKVDPLAAGYLMDHSNSLDISGNENVTYAALLQLA